MTGKQILVHRPAASANYMELIQSKEGAIASSIYDLRSRVIHLEPTLSFAIAWAGYEETHKLLHTLMRAAWQRLKAREEAILASPELDAKSVRHLRRDVGRFGELIDAMGLGLNDLKKNKLQFAMDIQMSVVDMVRVRWELEECGF